MGGSDRWNVGWRDRLAEQSVRPGLQPAEHPPCTLGQIVGIAATIVEIMLGHLLAPPLPDDVIFESGDLSLKWTFGMVQTNEYILGFSTIFLI
jgi:hypothetical protein